MVRWKTSRGRPSGVGLVVLAGTAAAALASAACGPKEREAPWRCEPGTWRACDLAGEPGRQACLDSGTWLDDCEPIPEPECDASACEQTGLCRLREPVLWARTILWAHPSLCWNGERLGMGWGSGADPRREEHFGTLTPDGRWRSRPVLLSNAYSPGYSRCAWSADAFGIVWYLTQVGVGVQTLDGSGEKIGTLERPMAEGWHIAAVDEGFLVGVRGRVGLRLEPVDRNATPVGQRLDLDSSGYPVDYLFAGGVHAVTSAYYASDPYFERFDMDGNQLGEGVPLAGEEVRDWYALSIGWSGAGYAVVAASEGLDECLLALYRFSADGVLLGDPVALSTAPGCAWGTPAIRWTGSDFVVVWREQDNEDDVKSGALRARRVTPDGTIWPEALTVSAPGGDVRTVAAEWTGQALTVAWDQNWDPSADHPDDYDYDLQLADLAVCD